MILVSIVVPIFNVTLDKFKGCMQCIQNQTLKDIEIILIDDCGELRECIGHAKELAEKDSRIIFLENERNMGAGYSRNRGIDTASGEYIAFVDADDRVDLDFYERLYEKTKEKPYDIVKGELFGVKGHLNKKIRQGLAQGKPLYEIFTWQHICAIYRAKYIHDNGVRYGSSRVSQDVTFLLRATVLAHSIATVDGTYYYYDRENTKSLTHTEAEKNVSEYCQAIQERMDFLVRNVDYHDPAFLRYVDFNTYRLTVRAKMLVESELTNNKCKVSAIVPVYNEGEYITELIESLQAQTLQDIEIIFVDDGSTDESSDIIHRAMEKDNKIVYCCQENAGAGAARNFGLHYAKGEYVIWLDADDLYDLNFLEKMYIAAESSEADVVMCLFRRNNYWTNVQMEDEGYKKDKLPLMKVFSGKDITDFCDCFNSGPVNKLYRRKFIVENELKYASTHIANDVLFGYGAMICAEKIFCLPENLLTVRRYVNPNSISATRQNYIEESIVAIDGLWNWAEKRGILDDNYQKQFTKIFVNATMYNSQYGANKKFMKECRNFIDKIIMAGIPPKTVQQLFNVDVKKIEDMLEELRTQEENEKKVSMLENKLEFIKEMKEYLKDFLETELPTEQRADTKKFITFVLEKVRRIIK